MYIVPADLYGVNLPAILMGDTNTLKQAPPAMPQRSNSRDTGGAVLRALARSPHYNENLHREDLKPVPALDLNDKTGGSMYANLVYEWEVPRKLFHCITGFVVLYLYKMNVNVDVIIRTLFNIFLVVASADLLRLNSPTFERFFESILSVLMRESEKERVNGVVWYLIGVMTSLHFFPEDIASVSIIVLAWCDPAASTFGRMFGKCTPSLPGGIFARRKSLAGFLAAWAVGSLIAYLFWGAGIAKAGERASGLSWEPASNAMFGTALMPDALRTGWRGFARGFAVTDSNFAERLRNLTRPRIPAMPPILMFTLCGLIAAMTEALELGGLDDNVAIPILFSFLLWFSLWAWGQIMSSMSLL